MDALQATAQAFASALRVERAADGQLVTLPLSLSNGNLIQILVEEISDDLWHVTDSGQAAAELALAGVNLETQKNVASSWRALVAGMPVSPGLMVDGAREYDLGGVADADTVGRTVLAVAQAVQQADGLRALAPGFRARRFRDVIAQSAVRRDLPVVFDAPMPTRHGGRRAISLKVHGSRDLFVQAISGKGGALDGFDKAQAVFSSASVSKESLVAVLATRLHLESWQLATLQEAGTPVTEEEFERVLDEVA